uniref:Scolopendrasin-9 n=1 Tax=Scolopendra mutilans TaxID=2836329 RepID=AIP9_SCOMU|nr:RecName: Full=Scolopendrasin-9; AltName: Full=Scolopendrasin IX [Scolopendra mutilans]
MCKYFIKIVSKSAKK